MKKQKTPQDKEAIWADYDPGRVRAGLEESAGALSGVDTEQLLEDIRASREQRNLDDGPNETHTPYERG